MKPDELFTSAQFILKFEPKKLTKSISVLDKNAADFKVDQVILNINFFFVLFF